MGGKGRSQHAAAALACAAIVSLSLSVSCKKPAEDTQGSWPGIYRAPKGEAGTGLAELSVDRAGKRDFAFFLRLVKENGFIREMNGTASYKGRSAAFSQEGVELDFSLEEGNPPSIVVAEGASKTLSAGGFSPSIRLFRESVGRSGGEGLPGEPAASAGTKAPGGAFKFGYYLPEGVDPASDALPESFVFLFFDKEGMAAREISMFEGNMTPRAELGTFTISDDSLKIQSKDKKPGRNKVLEWKRSEGDVLVSDAGQRYFFWKDNLQE